METIEPDTQETIIAVLPNNYDISMSLMCQLIANMMLSGDTPWDINKVMHEIKANLDAYAGT
jgi:hypothetical protein